MLDKGQNWVLFGYDVRRLGGYWLAAWRDLLWSTDSPLRARLDEAVHLTGEASGSSYYQAGEPVRPLDTECQAVLLPPELVLERELEFPIVAEGSLESALALEVAASSPFGADDTAWGWRVLQRNAASIKLGLGIASRSGAMTYLARQYDIHDSRAQEVWAQVGGAMLVLGGFGENHRESRYRRRLLRSAVTVAASAALLLVISAVAAGVKYLEMQQVQEMASSVKRDASMASNMRNSLGLANETIEAANALLADHPSPHYELARLTGLLPDDASLTNFTVDGRNLRIKGKAGDAASVMQTLTDHPAYEEVKSPRAITKLGDTGLEQFYLELRLSKVVAQ
jgi:hypothetical protein